MHSVFVDMLISTINSLRSSSLYGGGSSMGSGALSLTRTSVSPFVDNRAVFVPYYYSASDGYAALGVVNTTTGSGTTVLLYLCIYHSFSPTPFVLWY